MWQIIFAGARTYAPYITFPFALVVGFIGYNFEKLVRDRNTPQVHQVLEERNDRQLEQQLAKEDVTDVTTLKDYKPKPVFKFENTLRTEKK